MNAPRCTAEDSIQFQLASPCVHSCTEAARVQPLRPDAPAHDSLTRLLTRLEPDSEALWAEAAPAVRARSGVLVLDDTTLDKPHARHMGLVCRHWSGKHRRVVAGINRLTAVWVAADRVVPCDHRVYHRAGDGKTRNDHFRDLLRAAEARGLEPEYVLFDSWYAAADDFELLAEFEWRWLTRLRGNRLVRVDRGVPQAVPAAVIPPEGLVVHLTGVGPVKLSRTVAPDGTAEHWATDDLEMTEPTRAERAGQAWSIERYHRGLKQFTGVERCQCRSGRAQRNHIGLSIRAFVRLEAYCKRAAVSWWKAKTDIVRDAIRKYLSQPYITLEANA